MKRIILLTLLYFLAACSSFSKQDAAYLHSKNGRSLVVSPPLKEKNLSHFYDLPLQNQNAQVSILPPSSDSPELA